MSDTDTTTTTSAAPKSAVPEEVYKKWNIVYPIYLDSTRSSRKGRLIPKESAVPNPTLTHLLKACRALNLTERVVPEIEKKHPRDQLNPGRIRINMQDDAAPGQKRSFTCGGQFADKRDLLVAIAAQIKELQEKEVEQKEVKKAVLDQKQKKKGPKGATTQVRTFKDMKKKKGKR